MDPCDLRLKSGDGALRDLVARRTPLFEFAIRTALADHDLDSAEGRVAALRRCVPMVARIKDPTLRDEYARQLAGWVGWDDVAQVLGRVRETAQGAAARRAAPRRRAGDRAAAAAPPAPWRGPIPRDPTLWPQREALKAALQYPAIAGPVFDTLTVESFTHPGYAAVRAAIAAAGGTSAGCPGAAVDRGGPRAGGVARGGEPGQRARASRPSRSTTTSGCRATSAACWPDCRKCGSAGRSPR